MTSKFALVAILVLLAIGAFLVLWESDPHDALAEDAHLSEQNDEGAKTARRHGDTLSPPTGKPHPLNERAPSGGTETDLASLENQRVRVVGRVLDDQGQGLATTVQIGLTGAAAAGMESIEICSDDQGHFETILPKRFADDAAIEALVAQAKHPTLHSNDLMVPLIEADRSENEWLFTIELTMALRTSVKGRAIDTTSTAIPHCRVLLFKSKDGAPVAHETIGNGRCDEEGYFDIPTEPGLSLLVVASADAFLPATRVLARVAEGPNNVGDLVCDDAQTIRGTVTWKGEPLPNFTVTAVAETQGFGTYDFSEGLIINRWNEGAMRPWQRKTKSDAQGRFVFKGLAAENYRVSAGDLGGPFQLDPKREGASWYFGGEVDHLSGEDHPLAVVVRSVVDASTVITPAPASEVQVALRAGLVLIEVQDEKGPIKDIKIRILRGGSNHYQTDAKGQRMFAMAPGGHDVVIDSIPHRPSRTHIEVTENAPVKKVVIEVERKTLARLEFRVFDDKGVQRSFARFSFGRNENSGYGNERSSQADESGLHLIENVPPGKYWLRVRCEESEMLYSLGEPIVVPPSGEFSKTITLLRGACLKVGLKKKGQWLSEEMRLRRVDSDFQVFTIRSKRTMSQGLNPTLIAGLNEVVDVLEPGRWEVVIGPKNAQTTHDVTLSAGEVREFIIQR